MAVKKTELYSSLWSSCDELRGGMDASQYKDYVLTLLFMKYVSDKYAGDPNGMIVVPAGGSFKDMVALKGDKEIGDKINKIIGALAEENGLKGVIDVADFNDEDRLGKGKEMVDRLSNLVSIFDGIDLSANRAEGDDLLGDAYEYLMRHFATESGKSMGQFITAEVSRILAKVVWHYAETQQDQTVYDPPVVRGSLLLKVAAEAPAWSDNLRAGNGQLQRLALGSDEHDFDDHSTGTFGRNTLSSPHWKDADGSLKSLLTLRLPNPPFSYKSWSNGREPDGKTN
jgi:type I restriction enzyme M protein